MSFTKALYLAAAIVFVLGFFSVFGLSDALFGGLFLATIAKIV